MRYWVKMCSNKFLKLWFLLNLGIKKLSVLGTAAEEEPIDFENVIETYEHQ